MKKNICFLLYNLEPGGSQIHLLRFLDAMSNRFKATIIVKSGSKVQLIDEFKIRGCKVIILEAGYLNIAHWYRVFRIFKDETFTGICDFTGNFSGVYVGLAKLAMIRKRAVHYGLATNHFKEDFFRLIYNRIVNWLVFRYSTKIISNSFSGLNFFFPNQNLNDKRFEVISNFIHSEFAIIKRSKELKNKLGIPGSGFVIGNVARFDEKKNHITFLRVAAQLALKYESIYFIICGYGTEALSSQIEDLKLSNRIFPIGYQKNMPDVYSSFDAFYFPSVSEGQPLALMEALMFDLPIVSSNIDSIKELLPDNLYSQLVDPFDIDAATSKLQAIFNGNYSHSKGEIRNWAWEKFTSNELSERFYNCL